MKVYISCHHPDPANDLAAALRAAGHDVVSTWHAEGLPRPANDDVKAWCYKAGANFEQIRAADALVLIGGPDKYPGGKFVEAGYAYGSGVPVYVLGRRENGMLALCGFADDAATLIAILGV